MNTYKDDYLFDKLNKLIEKNKTKPCNIRETDKEVINNIFKYINKDNIISILLRGSYANGRNNPYSDKDVVVIEKKIDKNELSFISEKGIKYHLNIFDESFLIPNNDKRIYRCYYGMKKIYDPYNICEKLINDIKNYEINCCSKIIKENKETRNYLYRLLEYLDKGDELLSLFVKAKILKESPAFLSYYNGFNLIGYKTTIDCLLRDNYDLALVFGKALDKNSNKKDLKEWIDKAFNGLCGINVLNLDFSSSKKSYEVFVNGTSMYDLYNDYYDFIDYLNIINTSNITTYEFLSECKEKVPMFFKKIINFIK